MLQGLLTAIVTPMNTNGEIDYISLEKLINYQIENGANGLVILGSTGEANTLNIKERLNIISHAIKIIASRVPAIIGVSQISTLDAQEYITELNQINGVDYLLAVTPAYVKATQNGLYAHFSSIAKISTKPIILYNVPGRTACDLLDSTIIRLAFDHPNIVGLKDATGNIARCCNLVKHKPQNFAIYSGDDATTLAFVLCGGDGAISVTGNVAPKSMSEMIAYALKGEKASAIKLNNQMQDLHCNLFLESNPIPVKWSLYKLGIINYPVLRLPLQTLDKAYQEIVEQSLVQAELKFIN